jgi:LmbE family N-acetylglucosaminyl deacetylase
MNNTRAPANPIDAPGTAEATWRSWPGLARLPALDVTPWTSAVIVAAHPDDEVLGPGGIIAMLAAAGARLRVVAVTDGEYSHGERADPAALTRRRVAERQAALDDLGARDAEIIRLGLPDAALDGRDADIAAALDGLVTGFDACLASWAHDVHADHEAVGRAVARIRHQVTGSAWFFPVWMWHWARPADPGVPWRHAARVPLTQDTAARKRAAISRFGSQTEPRPGGAGPVLAPDFVSHFLRNDELLLPVEPS